MPAEVSGLKADAHLQLEEDGHDRLRGANSNIDQRNVRKSEWWQSASVITGEVMGTGVLSLPYACSRLGWVLGIGSSIAFGCAAMYSGILLARTKNSLFPEATSFADLAHATAGRCFGVFTRVAIQTGWALILPYYLVGSASALAAALPSDHLCFWHWSCIVMVVLAPVLQARSLHALAGLSMISTLAIMAVLFVMVPALISSRPAAGATTSLGLPETHFWRVYSSLGSFIFAYQGQSLFLEIAREMKQPKEFTKALLSANGLMVACYSGVSAVGYGSHGDAVASFLPDTLPPGSMKSLIGLLLAYHTMVAYLLTAQPLHRQVHLALFPATADRTSSAASPHWALISLGFLTLSFVVANAVPFFADLQDLIGNLFGAATVFGWPAYFFMRGSALLGRPVSPQDQIMCSIFLCICLPAFTLLGTYRSLVHIAEDWQTHGNGRSLECTAG